MAFSLDLAKMVKDAWKPITTRDEVVTYFQEKYPGVKRNKGGEPVRDKQGNELPIWKGKLAEALQPFATDSKGNPMKKDNIQRRFQNRKNKDGSVKRWESTAPGAKQKREYKELGKMISQPKGFHLEGDICVKYSPGMCEKRNLSINISGKDMAKFLAFPDMQGVFNVYNEQDYDADEPGGGPCESESHETKNGRLIEGCKPDFTVTAYY